MSKLSKLVLSPQMFLEDALANARTRAEIRLLIALKGARLPAAGGDRRLALSEVAGALETSLAATAEVFTTPSPYGTVELNCVAGDLGWLMYGAVVLAEGHGLTVRVTARRKTQPLTRRNVVGAIGRAQSATSIELVFGFPGGGEETVGVAVWERRPLEGIYYCRGNNLYAKKLPIAEFERRLDERRRVDLRSLYECPIDAECRFDVDVVYTWVDHRDPGWRSSIARYRKLADVDWDRYRSADELRYSMRSLQQFAPWVRRIFVVTNCARPEWLAEHPQVRWVSHEEVFPPSADYLPTFSSHAIESCLHRIPDLGEHFIYFNDDVFLGKPSNKQDFFASNGIALSHLEPYGIVLGETADDKPDYLNAAINGRRLIEDTFGVSPTRLHEHTPHALLKSVLAELEDRFPQEFDATRRSRFRSRRDISVVSFLFHHYAYQVRRAQRAAIAGSLLIRNANSVEAFAELRSGRRRLFFCINDGGASAHDHDYHARAADFLAEYFPVAAPWEAATDVGAVNPGDRR